LCGPVHVCNYIRFTCLFAFTVIVILFTVTTVCTMLISVLCGPVHVRNYIRFTCLFAFTVTLILFTVTTLWTCPISFCNDF
jgi:hypothetical protein